MYKLTDGININAPSEDFPEGQIRDSTEDQDGTALYTVLLNDTNHALQFIANEVGEIPDNTVDGELPQLTDSIHNYQLIDAFAKFISLVAANGYGDRFGRNVIGDVITESITKDGLTIKTANPEFRQIGVLSVFNSLENGSFCFDNKTKLFISTEKTEFYNIAFYDMTGIFVKYGPQMSDIQRERWAVNGLLYYYDDYWITVYNIENETISQIIYIGEEYNRLFEYGNEDNDGTVFFIDSIHNRMIEINNTIVIRDSIISVSCSGIKSFFYHKKSNRFYLFFDDEVKILDGTSLEEYRSYSEDLSYYSYIIHQADYVMYIRSSGLILVKDLDGYSRGSIFLPTTTPYPRIVNTPFGLYMRDAQSPYNLYYSPKPVTLA